MLGHFGFNNAHMEEFKHKLYYLCNVHTKHRPILYVQCLTKEMYRNQYLDPNSSTFLSPGRTGRVADLPALLALPGTHLQLRWHQPSTASGEQTLPDHGEDLEEDHAERRGEQTGQIILSNLGGAHHPTLVAIMSFLMYKLWVFKGKLECIFSNYPFWVTFTCVCLRWLHWTSRGPWLKATQGPRYN